MSPDKKGAGATGEVKQPLENYPPIKNKLEDKLNGPGSRSEEG